MNWIKGAKQSHNRAGGSTLPAATFRLHTVGMTRKGRVWRGVRGARSVTAATQGPALRDEAPVAQSDNG
ncbi:hypothetical protein Acsp04_50130 [Actinomadura sp. NBRC 104425]|nr:hypothetical protein Acsp04_50130 [Actinomadura sp. NBRC 104425]